MMEKKLLDSKPHKTNGTVETLTDEIGTVPIQSEIALFKPFGKKKKLICVSLLVVILATTFGSLKFLINRKISLKRTSEISIKNILSVNAIPIFLLKS